MKKLTKVEVDETIDSDVYICPRCNKTYCDICQPLVIVDFEVIDKPDGFNRYKEQWENREVCPWCYNQLIYNQLIDLIEG